MSSRLVSGSDFLTSDDILLPVRIVYPKFFSFFWHIVFWRKNPLREVICFNHSQSFSQFADVSFVWQSSLPPSFQKQSHEIIRHLDPSSRGKKFRWRARKFSSLSSVTPHFISSLAQYLRPLRRLRRHLCVILLQIWSVGFWNVALINISPLLPSEVFLSFSSLYFDLICLDFAA